MSDCQSLTAANQPRGRVATVEEIGLVVDLSSRVQLALTTAGSLQKIGPLQIEIVKKAIENHSCYVLESANGEILGCALSRPIQDDFFPRLSRPAVEHLSRPFHYLHSLMLEPKIQGLGMGPSFVEQILSIVRPRGGTVLLDCWAGSDKLRKFYQTMGFQFVAIMPKPGFEVALFAMAMSDDEGSPESIASSRDA